MLRPNVSCVNTLAYDLSAHSANLLFLLTGNSDFSVLNPAHFVPIISGETTQESKIMESFAVLSKRFEFSGYLSKALARE